MPATNGKNGYDLPKKVGIIYSDVKREYFPTESQFLTEKDAYKDVLLIAKYIEQLGIKVHLFPGDTNLPNQLKKVNPDVAFNLVGSVKGNEFLTAAIPGVLEILEIPYTGAGILGESLSYNKFLVKKIFEQNGIPVPHYQLFNTVNDPINPSLRFPLISKLNEIHGAVEITRDSISDNEKHLRERLKFLILTYKQPAIVEEFIVGREINAVLLEGLNRKVYLGEAVIEKPQGGYFFKSFELQWLQEGGVHYQKYNDPILKAYVKKAFTITDMADYGKFDIRVDDSGRYYFVDSNSNPYIAPPEIESPINAVLNLYGITFIEMLKRLLINTVRDAQGKERLPVPS